MIDYSAPLSDATRQIDSLTAALAGRKLDEAKTIVVDLRKRMDQVLAWIDSRPKERSCASPAPTAIETPAS